MYGPFPCENRVVISIGKSEFILITHNNGVPGATKSIALKSRTSGTVYGPAKYADGSTIEIGGERFAVVTREATHTPAGISQGTTDN